MKKEKFLKVLKYLGVACIGAFVGMGALVGVSSCASRSKTNKTQLVKRDRLLPSSEIESIIGSDKTYYAVAKNYAQNGEGVFYTGTISADNSADLPRDQQLALALKVSTIDSQGYYSTVFGALGYGKLLSVFIGATDDYPLLSIYNVGAGQFNREYCAFLFTDVSYNAENGRYISTFSRFFDVYELGEDTFQFNDNINYNAPYNLDISSPYFDSVQYDITSPYIYTLDLPFFMVNGQVYNRIDILYSNANGYRFPIEHFSSSGNYTSYEQVTSNNNVFFTDLYFVNTALDSNPAHKLNAGLNTREFGKYSSASNTIENYVKSSSRWLSPDYQTITFFETPSKQQITILNSFNENLYGYNSINGNIGLTKVFDLFTLAFKSWIPILSISVIPGVTIGMLMFMPLMVGIILAIIWLVKR